MNELDPDLKRLIRWACAASPSKPEEAPFGFSRRVVACRRQASPTLLQELQRAAWGLAGASLALIVCGGLVWASQPSAPALAAELSSALNFVVTSFPQ